MENPVYLYDMLVVIALITGAFFAWRTICRRLSRARNWWHKSVVGVAMTVLSVLLLHVWAQIRPLPIFVESNRPFTEKEKAWLISKGATRDFIDSTNNLGIAEYSLFNGTNAPNLDRSDIYKLKQLLAWNGILPLFPKGIEIRQDDSSSPVAYYKWIGSRQKHVNFRKDDGVWQILYISDTPADGIEPTNFLDKVIFRMPIDFKNF